MPDTPRKAQLNIVVGAPGTGKSTFIRQEVVEKRPKVLVVTPDTSEWRQLPEVHNKQEIYSLTGKARYVCASKKDFIENVVGKFYGGVLVMDDAMSYLDFQTEDTMRYLQIRRRQLGIDIYFVGHGLTQIPPQLFTFTSWIILFATTDNFSGRRNRMTEQAYNRVVEAQKELNSLCFERHILYEKRIIKIDPTL